MLLSGARWCGWLPRPPRSAIAAYFIYRLQRLPGLSVAVICRRRVLMVAANRAHRLQHLRLGDGLVEQLNYSIDAIVIGAYMSRAAVALWTVPQRLAEMLQRLTNQLNGVLFPVVVDSDAGERPERLRDLCAGDAAVAVPGGAAGAALFMLAGPLIRAWVGPKFVRASSSQILIWWSRSASAAPPAPPCSRAPDGTGCWPSPTPAPRSPTWRSACLDPPLRPGRPGDGHIHTGGALFHLRAVAGGVPARRHRRRSPPSRKRCGRRSGRSRSMAAVDHPAA